MREKWSIQKVGALEKEEGGKRKMWTEGREDEDSERSDNLKLNSHHVSEQNSIVFIGSP